MAETLTEIFTLIETQNEIALGAIALALLAAVIRPWQIAYRRGGAIVGNAPITGSLRREVQSVFRRHDWLYSCIAGEHPSRRIWHSQWLSVKDLYQDFHRILPTLRGKVLDVGCLGKPYAQWLTNADAHIGIDVTPGKSVDHVIREGERWPLESGAFQSVLCSQVLQVASDVPHLVNEMHRVLENGGIAVVSVPWCYNDMTADRGRSAYRDFWRCSFHGVQVLFADRFEILEARRQGGFGSTAGILFLNWVHIVATQRTLTQLLMVLLLPVWLLVCLGVNSIGWLLDKVDRTDVFYHNVLLVLRKKAL